MTTVQILASDLWTGEYRARRPLGDLDDGGSGHIHGRLEIVIGGRRLPRLGYWGPDDVCLDTSVSELRAARRVLSDRDAQYTVDEGEQGQPAYVFRRLGNRVHVSVSDSPLSDGPGEPDWQNVPCDATGFIAAIDAFLTRVEREVLALGEVGQRWLAATRVRSEAR